MRVQWIVVVLIAALVATATWGAPGLAQPRATLRMLASAGGSGRTFAGAIGEFEKQTGIKVDFIQAPYAEVREKQLLELTSGSGNIDVISIDDQIWLPELYHYLEPIDPYVRKDTLDLNIYVPSMLSLFRYTDPIRKTTALYGLPVRIGGWVLIYRKDLFQQAGIARAPRTMEEFLATAQKLTGGGRFGIAFALKQGNYLTSQWIPILRSFGGDVLDENKARTAFNTPQGHAATQFFVDLYRKHKVISPGAINYEQDGIIAAMQQGLAAMTITYSPYVLAMNDPRQSKFPGQFSVAPTLPYARDSGLRNGVTMVTGWGFGISRDSRNKDAAWQLVKFMGSPSAQKLMAIRNANSPTVTEVFRDKDFLTVFPEAQAVLSTLANARPRTGVIQWTRIEDILADELSAALVGDKTVAQALNDADQRVTQALKTVR